MTKNATRSNIQSWVRLAAAITLTIGVATACGSDDESTEATPAPSESTEPSDTTQPESTEPSDTTPPGPDPCEGYGTLQVNQLNDHCVEASDFAETLQQSLELWLDQSCPNGALVVARPHEVLVTVTEPDQLEAAVAEVASRLAGAANGDFQTSLAQVIDVPDQEMADVLTALPSLQGVGWSADLNYLEPLQPNDGFRPDGEPHDKGVQIPDSVPGGNDRSVLVVDSTDDESKYDLDGNGRGDEDHGHGVFVKSIIERQAADAIVTLQGVTSTSPLLASGRWVPMMFSDFDLIRAMEPMFASGTGADFKINKSYDVVNLSLGGAGCTTTSAFGHGVGERVALGRFMAALSAFDPDMRFVAAAGNDHGLRDHKEFKHFPAAWRDITATEALATAVADPVAGDEVRAFHATLKDAMIAVGSSDGDFSNCGDWINATAPGLDQIGTYWQTTARWSGTSFATANVSAQVAIGQFQSGSLPCPTP